MGRTITLSDIRITGWVPNITLQNVTVTYQVIDQNGDVYDGGEAIFWATIPTWTDPTQPQPTNWYQLPQSYVNTLQQLTADARTALLPLIN